MHRRRSSASEKSRGYGDVWLFEGAKTVRAFANEGLIDRYELYIVPELLGEGVQLFGPGLKR